VSGVSNYEAYKAGTNVVFLDPDVATAFGDSTSVNQALRLPASADLAGRLLDSL
jgi:hypothetical protein